MLRIPTFFVPLALIFCLAGLASAADLSDQQPASHSCAVSEVNGKFEVGAGKIRNDGGNETRKHIAASLSLPANCYLGLQFDANYGNLAGSTSNGLALHLFTRDPASYLFGLYGSVNTVGSFDYQRFAMEGELYFPDFTLTGLLGGEFSDFTRDEVFGAARITYYLTDDFQINLGAAHFLNISTANAGLEWQLPDSGFSLYADGAVGSDDHSTIFGGIRYHFGEQKSLKRRHREDDPLNWIEILKRVAMATEPEIVCVGFGAYWNPLTRTCEIPE
jgi:hypothetical protein